MSVPCERIDESRGEGGSECDARRQHEPPHPDRAGFPEPRDEPASLRRLCQKPLFMAQRSAAQRRTRIEYVQDPASKDGYYMLRD